MSGLLQSVHVGLSVRPRLQVMRSGRGSSSAACRMAVEMQTETETETETDESLKGVVKLPSRGRTNQHGRDTRYGETSKVPSKVRRILLKMGEVDKRGRL